MSFYYSKVKKIENEESPIITSEEIDKQTQEFLRKRGNKVQIIPHGARAQPALRVTKRDKNIARKVWGGQIK